MSGSGASGSPLDQRGLSKQPFRSRTSAPLARRDWWLGVVVLCAAISLLAIYPRYEWRTTNHPLIAIRVDRWTGASVAGRYDTLDGSWAPYQRDLHPSEIAAGARRPLVAPSTDWPKTVTLVIAVVCGLVLVALASRPYFRRRTRHDDRFGDGQ